MESKEIENLFSKLLDDPKKDDPIVREVFSILVQRTLEYRDKLFESKGLVLTVEDVRGALDCLVPALATGKMPKTENDTHLELLKTWIRSMTQSDSIHPSKEQK